MAEPCNLNLSSLVSGRPGITPSEGGCQAECAVLALERNGHQAFPDLQVAGAHVGTCSLAGPRVNDQIRRTHGDVNQAIERGACGIAILLMERYERLTVVQRSRTGTGFDYWLGPLSDEETDPGDNFLLQSHRLEVSGIGTGSGGDIRRRADEKLNRLHQYANPLTAFVVVVEFSSPQAQVIRDERSS